MDNEKPKPDYNTLNNRILEENLSSGFYKISEHCPLTSVILGRSESGSTPSTCTSSSPSLSPSKRSEIDSLKSELENLLKTSAERYFLLNYSIDSNNLEKDCDYNLINVKNNLKTTSMDLSRNNHASNYTGRNFLKEAFEFPEQLNSEKLARIVNLSLDSHYKMELCGSKYCQESKSYNPTKRSNLFKNLPKLESHVTISNDDKNRNEHIERFWSAVSEFIGEIPKDSLNFLKNLCEYSNFNDIDVKSTSYEPPFKKQKSEKEANSPILKCWEENLKIADEKITTNGTDTTNPLKRKIENLQPNLSIETCFGDLTHKIVASLTSNGVEKSTSDGIARAIKEMSDDAVTDRNLREKNLKPQSNPQLLKIKPLADSLDYRIAQELYKEGILEDSDIAELHPDYFKNLVGFQVPGNKEVKAKGPENDGLPVLNPKYEPNYIDNELASLKNQLKSVQSNNAAVAKELLTKANIHNKKHKAFKSLENVDFSLLEMYRKCLNMRSRRKSLGRKERELINEELDKRADVISQLQ